MNALPLAFTAVLATLLLSNCTTPNVGRASPRVYWMNTPEYRAQLTKLTLNIKEAQKRFSLVSVSKAYPMQKAWEAAVVDEWYHFRGPTKADICLSGWYVNGMTGAIQYRMAVHDGLKYRGQPKNFRWTHVEKLYGPIGQNKAAELRDHLRQKAETTFPFGFFVLPVPLPKSKLPEGGELDQIGRYDRWTPPR